MDSCPIYCINLASATERKRRMENRFRRSGLTSRVTFVNAINKNSRLVEYYGGTRIPLDKDETAKAWARAEVACFLSHLTAIRQFLADTRYDQEDVGAIICEDDILVSNDFSNELKTLFENVPKGTSLVALSYIVGIWTGFKWSGIDPKKNNLCTIVPDNTLGTQMYWISREYAVEVLDRYDRPFDTLSGLRQNELITSELIVRFSSGYIAYPLLAIEDCIGSYIRPSSEMCYHVDAFSRWGYLNFCECEPEEDRKLSPIYVAPKEGEEEEP